MPEEMHVDLETGEAVSGPLSATAQDAIQSSKAELEDRQRAAQRRGEALRRLQVQARYKDQDSLAGVIHDILTILDLTEE